MANLEQDCDNVNLLRTATPVLGEDALISSLHPDQFTSANCVICLDQLVQSVATALPCTHKNFHFLCLATWLQQSRLCPLCKVEVNALQYQEDTTGSKQIFAVGSLDRTSNSSFAKEESHTPHTRIRSQFRNQDSDFSAEANRALLFRRHVYEHKLYSLYIGSNSISKYRKLTPHLFSRDERLLAKAKKWIRRELQVFDHLGPGSSYSRQYSDRRANNAEFLLNYIVAILKTIDLRGSAGQAEELLRDFLGRNTARLFLHELEAFLRSPYENLSDWDSTVQYSALP